MACAASMTAFRPEPHTLLIVMAGTVTGSPALITACRAGFWPTPAASTWPMITSSTWSGLTPARASTSLMTMAPSSDAGTLASEPPNLPIAVRAAATMTALDISLSSGLLFDVATGRRLDHLVFRAAVLLRRGLHRAAELRQPLAPVGPPAAGMLDRVVQPGLRVRWQRVVPAGPVAALVLRRRIDAARDVAAGAEHVAHAARLAAAGHQARRSVGGLPRHDVVLARREHVGRHLDPVQVDRLAAARELVRHAQVVLEVHVAQVPGVHRPRQVDAVAVPVQQVEHRRWLGLE